MIDCLDRLRHNSIVSSHYKYCNVGRLGASRTHCGKRGVSGRIQKRYILAVDVYKRQAFAFPMVRKLLLMFNLNNVTLFVFTVIISFAVFALFYIIAVSYTHLDVYKRQLQSGIGCICVF